MIMKITELTARLRRNKHNRYNTKHVTWSPNLAEIIAWLEIEDEVYVLEEIQNDIQVETDLDEPVAKKSRKMKSVKEKVPFIYRWSPSLRLSLIHISEPTRH